MSQQLYDLIAEAYSKTDSSLTKEYVAKPTLVTLLGDTSGKKVIDLGCGSGYSTRLVRGTGSNEVVGVDVSSQQILIAQEMEKKKPLGITYQQSDVSDDSFLQFHDFDVATALYLLHYASTKDELYTLCNNIHHSLRPGGRFITINSNSDNPTLENAKYGITAKILPPVVEGATRIVTYLDEDQQICSFNTYFWEKETYEAALTNAGFEEIEWHRLQVSEDGIRRFGKQFWDELLENPFICGLTCIKPL